MKDTSAPLLDQARVQRSFRRGLETYHRHAVAQARIAQDLAAMLAGAGAPRKLEAVLEFGCGTGLLTEALLGRFGIAGLTLNDLVAEAAPGLQARTAGQARFLAGPIEQLPLPDGLDLIASASTVQWVEDIPALMARLAASLRPGGWLALSGFGRGHFPELAALGSGAAAPGDADGAEWAGLLPPGMELLEVVQQPIVLTFGSAMELLRHLRRTGVNGQARARWSRASLQAFEESYRARFGQQGRLPLTYDAVRLIARKRS